MKHYGDITKIDGTKVPIVDIICGGSPCQDLSIAGKRAGLKHSDKGDEETTRSGLFMEQIRIVKEIREEYARQLRMQGADDDFRLLKPRFMVWENVPGAFSSNKGEDFRCVLEEICRVADQAATVPLPEKGKWSTSGCIVGDGWSVAWRVHDAQFWGVPQRRKRIALVADFGSESAGKILFECKSVPGDIAESENKGEIASGTVGRSFDTSGADVTGYDIFNFAKTGNVGRTLSTPGGGLNEHIPVITEPYMIESSQKNAIIQNTGISATLTQLMGTGGNNVPMVEQKQTKNDPSEFDGAHPKKGKVQKWENTEINDTLNVFDNAETRTPTLICEQKVFENHGQDCRYKDLGDVCNTVSATYGMGGNNQPLIVKCDDEPKEKDNGKV